MECWLDSNRRALLLGCIVPTIVGLLGLGAFFLRWSDTSLTMLAVRICGAATFIGALAIISSLLLNLKTPRMGFDNDSLVLHLRHGEPIRVPIDVVEVFFMGQGPSKLGHGKVDEAETQNVVVRLAEAAKDWHHRDVKPALGHWCEGYIVLRGAWCEPINAQTLERLNKRLVMVKRARRADAEATK